jgi:Zn-dependent protease with chaperone function
VSRFAGRYFDGRSSRALEVEVWIDGASLRLRGEGVDRVAMLEALDVSSRLAGTPRQLRFPDGASVELPDGDALADALAPAGRDRGRLLAALERHTGVALLALVASVAALAWAVRAGVPALARVVAERLPESVEEKLGAHTLSAIDGQWFAPSELDAATRARLAERFAALGAALALERTPALEHRRGDELGANAFALPGGTIVVTDELVALAGDEDEVAAVLAHELGHVRHRHALRSALQNVGVGVLIAGALGDFASISAVSGSLPVLLTELHYSRSFEREADASAAETLDAVGIPRERLARMLERLAESHGGDAAWAAYLSTHPATAERAEALRRGAPPP